VLFGYARVSTAEQNPDHQIDALLRAGVAAKDIYVDHASGAKAIRPELDTVLRMLRDGDTLKITWLDRLGRSVLHLVTLGAELRERGIGLHVTEQGIDTTTAEGRAMFGMLSVLAEFQRELILANTRDGLSAARARGRTGGRRPVSTPSRSPSHKSSTTSATTASSRSPTSSACPAPPSTGTSTTQARASAQPFTANRIAPPRISRLRDPRRRRVNANGGW
jgi:DNA invertase Pin-like site-specific DNA recombinase